MRNFWTPELCNAANTIREAFIKGSGRITQYMFDAFCRQCKADAKAAQLVFSSMGMQERWGVIGKTTAGIAEFELPLYLNGRPA